MTLDANGSWFGTAALVMSRLPGRSEVNRMHADGCLVETAAALARIHRAPADPTLKVTIGPQPANTWVSPSRLPRAAMLRRAHQTVEQLCDTESEHVLIHGDFFSGNLVGRVVD